MIGCLRLGFRSEYLHAYVLLRLWEIDGAAVSEEFWRMRRTVAGLFTLVQQGRAHLHTADSKAVDASGAALAACFVLDPDSLFKKNIVAFI